MTRRTLLKRDALTQSPLVGSVATLGLADADGADTDQPLFTRALGAPHDHQRAPRTVNCDRLRRRTSLSSLDRTIEADVLRHHVTQDERMLDPDLLARSGGTARTLIKVGPMRLLALTPEELGAVISRAGYRAKAHVTESA